MTKMLRVRFCKQDGTDWTEWEFPKSIPVDRIHLKMCDEDGLQVFLGARVFGALSKRHFLREFRAGRGYEYIEEWKMTHSIALSQLSGVQLLRVTELLRQFGHARP